MPTTNSATPAGKPKVTPKPLPTLREAFKAKVVEVVRKINKNQPNIEYSDEYVEDFRIHRMGNDHRDEIMLSLFEDVMAGRIRVEKSAD